MSRGCAQLIAFALLFLPGGVLLSESCAASVAAAAATKTAPQLAAPAQGPTKRGEELGRIRDDADRMAAAIDKLAAKAVEPTPSRRWQVSLAILLTIGGLIVTLAIALKDLLLSNLDRANKMTDRLIEIDKILLDHPELQMTLERESGRKTADYFASAKHEQDFVRLKAFLYANLNVFDEIISIAFRGPGIKRVIEFDAWQHYIIRRLRHPLFRELYDSEQENWGPKFARFRQKHWQEIEKPLLPGEASWF
jgi:hypothetical protein